MQRILVVDDSEMNRELLQDMLKNDYVIEMAEDGRQALHKLEKYSHETVALLLDLNMPVMDGFSVIAEMRRNGWMNKIPILIISSEYAAEVESTCLELGVSDFIHRPFEERIVKNRVRNTIELFSCKNQLEERVEKQEEQIEEQKHIIQMQAEKLREEKSFNKLMLEYSAAIMEVETRLKVLNKEFSQEYNRNPFEAIKSRLKSPESIFEKLERRGFPMTVEGIRENLTDVAGLRVICSFPDDIYRLAELFTRQWRMVYLKERND